MISSFIPTPMDVLGDSGTCMVLRGSVQWGIALILILVTRGTLCWKPAQGILGRFKDQEGSGLDENCSDTWHGNLL